MKIYFLNRKKQEIEEKDQQRTSNKNSEQKTTEAYSSYCREDRRRVTKIHSNQLTSKGNWAGWRHMEKYKQRTGDIIDVLKKS